MTSDDQPMEWDKYAPVYDVMYRNNPSYQANLKLFRDAVQRWRLGSDPAICDVGAGTGNFIATAAPLFPEARFVHLDFNKSMNCIAREKYLEHGLTKVEFVEDYVQRVDFPEDSFDLIVCVHALYAMSPQQIILKKLSRWLKPDGFLFIIDLGREQHWADWAWYIYKEMLRENGFLGATREAFRFFEVARQNQKTSLGQKEGAYPLHSTTEFSDLLCLSGFEVRELDVCYRGYSDVAICTKQVQTEADGDAITTTQSMKPILNSLG